MSWKEGSDIMAEYRRRWIAAETEEERAKAVEWKKEKLEEILA